MKQAKAEKLSGLFAALLTPTAGNGKIDLQNSDTLVDFLLDSGVDGICVGGCTAEYPHFSTPDRMDVIRRTARRLRGRAQLLTAIGASTLNEVLALGACAAAEGSRAVLVPTPHFFRYAQDDLEAFVREVCRSVTVPCLFYHIPSFSNSLDREGIVKLLKTEANLIGIKDSSGLRESLSILDRERGEHNWSLMVGDDSLLFEGLKANWDGGISGVACFCPELLVGLVRSCQRGQTAVAERYRSLLEELIAQIDGFPTPWGIRFGLEARGFPVGEVPLPLSGGRVEQKRGFQAWFSHWWSVVSAELAQAPSALTHALSIVPRASPHKR